MDNKQDWEELEKWAEEKEQEKIKILEKNIAKKKFKNKDASPIVRILTSVMNFLIKLVITLGALVFLGAIAFIFVQWSNIARQVEAMNPPVIKTMKDSYSEFKLIIEEVKIEKEDFGLYRAYPKETPDIKFHIYKDETKRIYNDFQNRYEEYYLENFYNEDIKNSLTIKRATVEYGGAEFITWHEYWLEIDSYEDIEEAVRKLYELHQYFWKECKDPWWVLQGGVIRTSEGYISDGAFEYDMSFEEILKREQDTYKMKHNINP